MKKYQFETSEVIMVQHKLSWYVFVFPVRRRKVKIPFHNLINVI